MHDVQLYAAFFTSGTHTAACHASKVRGYHTVLNVPNESMTYPWGTARVPIIFAVLRSALNAQL